MGRGLAWHCAGVAGAGPGSSLQAAWDAAQTWFAPVDGNPLRTVLQDTGGLRPRAPLHRDATLHLFIGATNVRSGKLRISRGAQISLDAVVASACLPVLFPAVEIDGESYWDGG